ncbi:Phenol hydroxylase P2 protein [Paraburkholderia piptadeniae]|uniref:Monooxygenase n=2 Tax=Paraburkholderia TaxID=1822464 RepID=A0A7X1NK38_9BURK|nr:MULTISPECIES: MmoB/DmpM family protein [Paraburkholderia]MPW22936.1 monooxygenase [Paraburkholderia franconis]SIT46490.1 Phenol hydroxylase P2 protein [Paraburkholderia piptadeniae]
MQNVYIALQNTDETRAIVAAITSQNPQAAVTEYPAMVKIDAPGKLVISREHVSEEMGRDWNIQELQLNLISLSGNIDETDDAFTLHWHV